MNASNAAAFIPLVQALADGKTIQVYHHGRKEWEDMTDLHFCYHLGDYRIKADPREWKIAVYKHSGSPGFGFGEAHYYSGDENPNDWEIVTVREILG